MGHFPVRKLLVYQAGPRHKNAAFHAMCDDVSGIPKVSASDPFLQTTSEHSIHRTGDDLGMVCKIGFTTFILFAVAGS